MARMFCKELKKSDKTVMGGYLRLSDLERPVQDDLDKDVNQKE